MTVRRQQPTRERRNPWYGEERRRVDPAVTLADVGAHVLSIEGRVAVLETKVETSLAFIRESIGKGEAATESVEKKIDHIAEALNRHVKQEEKDRAAIFLRLLLGILAAGGALLAALAQIIYSALSSGAPLP